jgi:hypothetical protein
LSQLRAPIRFTKDDVVCFLSFLRVWIPKHGYETPSLLTAWDKFRESHLVDQSPQIQDTTRLLTEQLIERNTERNGNVGS